MLLVRWWELMAWVLLGVRVGWLLGVLLLLLLEVLLLHLLLLGGLGSRLVRIELLLLQH